MINRLSASASEIFAGIQDYGRGIIVGEQSFGKGTVQSLVALQEGQLKITESKFYRISGESTQHRGVLPDILFPSLFDPTQIGESALDNAWLGIRSHLPDSIAITTIARYCQRLPGCIKSGQLMIRIICIWRNGLPWRRRLEKSLLYL